MAISIPLNLKYSKSYSMCCPAIPSDAHLKLVFESEKGSIFLKSSDLEKYRRFALHHSCDGGGPITRLGPESSPLLVELEPICDESHFDAVVGEARSPQEPVVVLWLANWCRKCIYLKPKLERLAADYYPRVRFYSIDVNKVPHRLVVRAGVTKMPTIQLWRDGRKQSEVIGGQKAHLVVSEVHEMIESQYDSI